jgi:PTH2 family peptidyl-tRNA hydrolase
VGEYNIKQYLLVNNSLGMRPGKVAAQVSHASLKVFVDRFYPSGNEPNFRALWLTDDMAEWLDGAFAKIALKCENADRIFEAAKIAEELCIPFSIIHDNGITQVEPGSLTAAAIGPFDTENPQYQRMTENLKELKLL